ncbi:MAG: 1-deoxy-D-xylulose-5-phosphate synthase [Roseibacillus sp.]|nr:1-deoxy-D-xylulose-5-phosphate synthase [Roseibacillus sp.]MBP35084.1 1-deoxy-D-xylulose-5-phosphate synthase [Roseibacillus sp.]MCP4729106.1 1-deoxy-D-xylulose-5-phosphate synthase [Roseibacillus sp.]MDP7308292.1 1-deoxy-D-xylulose-5-phosphate synthase [Roseibacillus sp.]HJM62800.1 1-deoxy-D-xylulose-5-phosphate synthase [Roseibacillus sp.]
MTSDSSSSRPAPETSLLSDLNGPEDLQALDDDQLVPLAEEIREVLIRTLSRTGGHLGPNLGVVELTIALHRVFNTPADKFIMDVSHQGYVHKMLTGRGGRIESIRQYEGLNGFLLRTESEHDCYGAGHAGTALSAALGMAAARDLKGGEEHVVAIAGDAAFTCGPTLEALNNIEGTTKRFIVILNDNEWSIDKNVGAIAKYFNALQTNKAYSGVRQKAADFASRVGPGVRRLAHKIERSAKNLLFPNVLFEKFGVRYFGPLDGHNLPLLVRTFDYLKDQEEPVILHIITEKGRGYKPALDKPGKFHGLGPYNVEDGSTRGDGTPSYSEVFGRTVTNLAKKDEKIVAITAAMPGGTKLEIFKEEIPERYFDVGIAEEHAALFACGLATQGLKPFLAIYSTFMQRAYDMIIHDMALQELPVRLCMDRGGLSGDDGPTHHGLFDIGYLRHIPNIVHMQPIDEDEFVDMLWTMAHYENGPIAVRYPRGAGTGAQPKEKPRLLEIGKGELIHDGCDVALIGLGAVHDLAVEARATLEARGYSAALVNPRFIKPLDKELILDVARRCKVICTFEDHVIKNGFGASVIECLHDARIDTPVERVGWPDEFVEHGKVDILRDKHGITSDAAVEKVLPHLPRKAATA